MKIARLLILLLFVAPGLARAAGPPTAIDIAQDVFQTGQDIGNAVSCALASAVGATISTCASSPSLPSAGCSGSPTSIIGALQCLDSDNSAQMSKLGTLLVQAMDTQEQNRTNQANGSLAAREGAKYSVSATRCQAVSAGAALASGEQTMQATQLNMAVAQANRSQGVKGTATASGQAAAVAELAQAHAGMPSGSQPGQSGVALADGTGNVTDLSAASLFADEIANLPPGASGKLKNNKITAVAELFIQHVFDPKPPPPQRNPKEAPDIQEARNTRAARMDLAMAVPLDLAARQTPQYSQALRSMLVPVSDAPTLTGQLSWNELMRYSIEGRYANAAWYLQVQSAMSETDKQNEALYMQALELYLDYYQMRFEQKVGVVAAALYAGGIDAMPGSTAREIDPSLPSREP